MQYLKIENIGVCPSECFTMLGISTSRYSKNSDVIGQFGSGIKKSISLFIRKGLPPFIFSDLTRLEFFAKDLDINDGISSHRFNQVCCKFSGKLPDGKSVNRTEELSWTTQDGELDWNDLTMAAREFVSNAIDRTIKETGSSKGVIVEVVEENQVRAKSGTTRIFIPFVGDIVVFFNTIKNRFLHFSSGINNSTLEKAARNIKLTNGQAVIYRKGVYVRELKGKPSCFDYNFGTELHIDESRNCTDYSVQDAMVQALQKCNKVKLLEALPNVYEAGLSSESLKFYCYEKEEWKKAWNSLYTPYHVLSCGILDELILQKKMIPVRPGDNWYNFLSWCGVVCDKSVLNNDEVEGREIVENTDAVNKAFYKVWHFFSTNSYNMGRDKPEVKVFRQIQPGNKTLGFYKNGIIYIHKDIAGGDNINLTQTMLEEVTHHVTQASDMSRELQEFTFKIISECLLTNR
jgi:hypothetical protein